MPCAAVCNYNIFAMTQSNSTLFNRDARLVAFRKSGSLGIQVSGGNKTGIFVAAVKEGSPAYNEGLRKGDQVLMVSTLLNQ